ncbi:MAG: metal-dependent hydrolase [Xanthobacteraceae bacterium]
MELVTHALCGLGLSQCHSPWAGRRDVAGVLVAASLLPDIDAVFVFVDPTSAALQRRMWTHSLVFLPPVAIGAALLFFLLFRRLSLSTAFILTALGVSVHLLLDLINAYGVGLLYPVSSDRFELPLLFIADPVIIGLLAVVPLCGWLYRSRNHQRTWPARCAFAAIAIYVGLSFHLREVALAQSKSLRPGDSELAYLTPEPFAPFRWKAIYDAGGAFEQAVVFPLGGRVERLGPVASCAGHPLVVRARADPIVREVENLLKAPVWSVRGQRVSVFDLRFRFSNLENDWDPFVFSFDVGREDIRLVRTSLRERFAQAVAMVRDVFVHAADDGRSKAAHIKDASGSSIALTALRKPISSETAVERAEGGTEQEAAEPYPAPAMPCPKADAKRPREAATRPGST